MTKQFQVAGTLTRRNMFKIAPAGILLVPAGWVAILKLKDNPLPTVEDPDLVLANGWLLDADDIQSELQVDSGQ